MRVALLSVDRQCMRARVTYVAVKLVAKTINWNPVINVEESKCIIIVITYAIACYGTIISKDITQSGHILGDPGTVSGPPVPERSLSPPAVCIVRAIMHSAFLWFSCHHTEMYGKLAAIVKPKVPQSSLPKFFWRHLKKDIEQLSRATGKSPDESAIIVHLVLQNMLLKAPPTCESCSLTVYCMYTHDT